MEHVFSRDEWHRHSPDSVISVVTQRLTNVEQVQRSEAAVTMSRMRLYNGITTTVPGNPALHIEARLTRRQRSLISKLRGGTLPLSVETGHYTNKPEQQRLCLSCGDGQVENEIHFIFKCPRYDVIRQKYDILRDGPNVTPNKLLKAIFVNSSNIRKLASNIHDALDVRLH